MRCSYHGLKRQIIDNRRYLQVKELTHRFIATFNVESSAADGCKNGARHFVKDELGSYQFNRAGDVSADEILGEIRMLFIFEVDLGDDRGVYDPLFGHSLSSRS